MENVTGLRAEIVSQTGFDEYLAIRISGIHGTYTNSVVLRLSQADYAMIRHDDNVVWLLNEICDSLNNKGK